MLGKYRLLERIGSGAMGEVYRAEHVLLGRAAAVKVLRPEFAHDEQQVERFFAEARALNLAGHRNIVEVTDVTREPDGTAWFVMELLEGSDLASRMHAKRLSLSQSLEIAQQLCAALDAVHKAGIVHHDIKPENVFIAQRDGQDVVKLVDFGIARLPESAHDHESAKGVTFNGMVVGSPPYMAPEQACGMVCDRRADLYAVGAVMFEMITGRALFERANMRALLEAVVFAPAPRVGTYAELPSSVSAEIERLIARCLAKQPARRPATARALGAEIAAIRKRLDGSGTSLARTKTKRAPVLDNDDRGTDAAASELLARCRPVWHKPALWIGASALLLAGATWVVPPQEIGRYLRSLDPSAQPAEIAGAQPQSAAVNTLVASAPIVSAPATNLQQTPSLQAQTLARAQLVVQPIPALAAPQMAAPQVFASAAIVAAEPPLQAKEESAAAARQLRAAARRARRAERAEALSAPMPRSVAAAPVLTVTPIAEEPTADPPDEPSDVVAGSELLDPYATE